MADDPHSRLDDRSDGFEQQAQRAAKASSGPLREFLYFLGRTRNFWLVPIIVAVLLAKFVNSGTGIWIQCAGRRTG